MSSTLRILGQASPDNTGLLDVYVVPTGKSATLTSFVVCNRSTATTFRIAAAPGNVTVANRHYLYYDLSIPANETFAGSLDASLSAGDVVWFNPGNGNLSLTLFGREDSV